MKLLKGKEMKNNLSNIFFHKYGRKKVLKAQKGPYLQCNPEQKEKVMEISYYYKTSILA